MIQALEGKDIKELLTNIGSAGPAAPVAAGGAAPEAAPAEDKKKEEGMADPYAQITYSVLTPHREGGVRRGHGLRSVRLSASLRSAFSFLSFCCSSSPRFPPISFRI